MDNAKIAAMTVNIVSAYVKNNRVDADEVATMLKSVGSSLHAAANPAPAPKPEEPRKRRVVRRRGGKVVDGNENTSDTNTESSLTEDAANDELIDGGEEISDKENMVAPPTRDASGGDESFNEYGHKKQPEPMFED